MEGVEGVKRDAELGGDRGDRGGREGEGRVGVDY